MNKPILSMTCIDGYHMVFLNNILRFQSLNKQRAEENFKQHEREIEEMEKRIALEEERRNGF